MKTEAADGDLMLVIVDVPVGAVRDRVSVNDSVPSITPSELIVYVT